MLEVVGVRKAYREIVGLVGPNGAGKSPLVSTIAGLLRPDAGTVKRVHQMMGLAPQDLGLYPTITVGDNSPSSERSPACEVNTSHLAGGRDRPKRVIRAASDGLLAVPRVCLARSHQRAMAPRR